jgi:hypothetical protein
LRAHPGDAVVLATGSDPRRASKLNAADLDAVAEGYKRGSDQYFAHVDRFLGTTSESASPRRQASASGNQPGFYGSKVVLTKRQAEAAVDGTHIWNYGPKKGQPIGREEFARRLKEQTEQGHFNRLD